MQCRERTCGLQTPTPTAHAGLRAGDALKPVNRKRHWCRRSVILSPLNWSVIPSPPCRWFAAFATSREGEESLGFLLEASLWPGRSGVLQSNPILTAEEMVHLHQALGVRAASGVARNVDDLPSDPHRVAVEHDARLPERADLLNHAEFASRARWRISADTSRGPSDIVLTWPNLSSET